MEPSSNNTRNDPSKQRNVWVPWLKRGVTILFFILVVVLLFSMIRNVDWNAVSETLRGYSLTLMLMGLGITAASFIVFSSYDLLGKFYTGHEIPVQKSPADLFVMSLITFACHRSSGGALIRQR